MPPGGAALRRAAQPRGMVLLVVLSVLVVMALGTLTLVRAVDSAGLIVGNLALQQSATQSADWGLEHAVLWLRTQHAPSAATGPIDVPLHHSSAFYRADGSQQGPGANTQESWEQQWDQVLAPAALVHRLPVNRVGQRVSYVIDRLCRRPGAATSAHCARGHAPAPSPGADDPLALATVYYRITVRVDGPRDTLSLVQAVVALSATAPIALQRLSWRELTAY